ncbi:MAG: hypothetical protein R3C51_15275 [Parvularculaceae bacterium]
MLLAQSLRNPDAGRISEFVMTFEAEDGASWHDRFSWPCSDKIEQCHCVDFKRYVAPIGLDNARSSSR